MRVHISKLFIGDEEVENCTISEIIERGIPSDFAGYKYPDGHIYVCNHRDVYCTLHHMYAQGQGEMYNLFRKLCPHDLVPIRLISKIVEYKGNRVPESFSVSLDVVWTDYDSFHHMLSIYRLTREAYETTDEFEKRRLDAKPVETVKMKPSNLLLFSIDSYVDDYHYINIDENLRA